MGKKPKKISQFRRQEIEHLWKNAQQVKVHAAFTLLKTDRQASHGRILIVIPKRTGNAPFRNKIRRQIKAIFMNHEIYTKDFDWIIIIKKAIRTLSFSNLQEHLLHAMHSQNDISITA